MTLAYNFIRGFSLPGSEIPFFKPNFRTGQFDVLEDSQLADDDAVLGFKSLQEVTEYSSWVEKFKKLHAKLGTVRTAMIDLFEQPRRFRDMVDLGKWTLFQRIGEYESPKVDQANMFAQYFQDQQKTPRFISLRHKDDDKVFSATLGHIPDTEIEYVITSTGYKQYGFENSIKNILFDNGAVLTKSLHFYLHGAELKDFIQNLFANSDDRTFDKTSFEDAVTDRHHAYLLEKVATAVFELQFGEHFYPDREMGEIQPVRHYPEKADGTSYNQKTTLYQYTNAAREKYEMNGLTMPFEFSAPYEGDPFMQVIYLNHPELGPVLQFSFENVTKKQGRLMGVHPKLLEFGALALLEGRAASQLDLGSDYFEV